jgi:hypothetical protein
MAGRQRSVSRERLRQTWEVGIQNTFKGNGIEWDKVTMKVKDQKM